MEYLINLAILFGIYSMLALSLNMLIGMGGLVSLAQAAFYGIGAYATAIGMTALGLGFFTTIILGIAINSVLAFVVGKILARFQGDYYAIVSAGLSIIVFSILQNWKSVLKDGGWIIFEVGEGQAADVRTLLLEDGFHNLGCTLDTLGTERVIYAQKKKPIPTDSEEM